VKENLTESFYELPVVVSKDRKNDREEEATTLPLLFKVFLSELLCFNLNR
jgi:hypothetical protein